MRRNEIWQRACALSLALLLVPAAAQDDGAAQATEALRPTGPVTLTADSAEWVQGGAMQYRGNVALRSDTLQLSGDTMSVEQFADGQFAARIEGAPARLDHPGQPDATGASAQPVTAEAARIDYDAREGVIRLSGGARLLRGGDEVTGERIDYLVAQRRIQAAGGDSGQVRIVIQPPPREDPAPSGQAPLPEPAP